jgi:SPP1 family predicted phage head-tail adaptor
MPDPLILQPGTLCSKITFQQASNTRDAAGQPISAWNNVLTTRAAVESTLTATYKSSFSGGGMVSQSSHIITTHWPGSSINITPDMRIIWGDLTFQINAVDNVQLRNRVLKIYCMTIDAGSN